MASMSYSPQTPPLAISIHQEQNPPASVPFTAQPRNFVPAGLDLKPQPIHLRGVAHRQDFLDHLFAFFIVKE